MLETVVLYLRSFYAFEKSLLSTLLQALKIEIRAENEGDMGKYFTSLWGLKERVCLERVWR